MHERVTRALGLIVNPIAGMGGAVGLHGTDGADTLAEARRRGAQSHTAARTKRAIAHVDASEVRLFCASGPMGGDVLAELGRPSEYVAFTMGDVTTGDDTQRVARALRDVGCDLILFAGGDGTASDVVRGVGTDFPILGIPSGVKMRSGVFAKSPDAAGVIAQEFLTSAKRRVSAADLLDVDDHSRAEKFLGVATVPRDRERRVSGAKASTSSGSRAEFDALCAAVADELDKGVLYLFGPGSTTQAVMSHLGLSATPLGVDAVSNGQLIGTDLSEDEILAVMSNFARTKLVLGVVGGQGFLLGRGNQQLGERILRRLGPEDLVIISDAKKLLALDPAVLWVDVEGPVPAPFLTYHRVRVAPRRCVVMRVAMPS
jgi:predicted polyphosphate/ATP-dependent NAD kinase